METLLISFEDVQNETPLFGDGSEKVQKIEICIRNSQRKLKPIICDELYDLLLAGDYDYRLNDLFIHVRSWLCWEAFAMYCSFSQATDTDAGLRVFKDENSDKADSKMLETYAKNAENFAIYYLQELKSFLIQNIEDYPEFEFSRCYSKCVDNMPNLAKISGTGYRKPELIRNKNNRLI